MTTTEISISPRLIKTVCKQQKVKPEDLEAYYLYDKDIVCVNLGCDTFRDSKESSIIKDFSRVVTHEFLHKVIYTQTNEVSNDFEEQIVIKMSKNR